MSTPLSPTPALPQRSHTQLFWFLTVGCSAAAVHWSTATVLALRAHWLPLVANVAGWLVALGVSFSGHYWLTFRHANAPLFTALRRFFFLSALGFAVNEASCAWLLHMGAARFDLVLAAVLVGVALLTFLLSRHWAFASNPN